MFGIQLKLQEKLKKLVILMLAKRFIVFLFFFKFQIEIIIDNNEKIYELAFSVLQMLQTKFIYLGSAPKQNHIYKVIKKNFVGCLRNVSLLKEHSFPSVRS
jgi:hypothetical protein